ncbi:hypothetical protein L5G32_09620 [Gordonia sp. HY002]|uniref:hypothetical protein n=1 Tax=Gordonia zhenghanii TaxID=2911516 RepID=UPI001EF12953|nr:hypothetical protein [Gordonia zhenghanii]MCF8570525.1 hypothetical protein [Gordonia zhenghanii]MCF8602518.1 hypothetical protein [Gordonia zhenghanii]
MTYPMPPHGPKRSPFASPAVLVAIVVGVLVLIGGVAGAFVYANSQSDETDTAAPASQSETNQDRPSQSTVTVTQPPSQAPTTPQQTAAPAPTTAHSSPSVSGATWQGFVGSSAQCNADDAAVFIGYTDRSQVVICQVGSQEGRNYYKGAADGGSVEIGYPSRSGDVFTAVNGGTTYQVSTSSLLITEPDGTPHVETMIQAWVD